MAITKLEEWNETASSNTEMDGIPTTAGAMYPSDARKFSQEIMSQVAAWIGDDTIASASTTDLGSVPARYVSISGTTTITSFGTIKAGTIKYVKFEGALTLTHNATSLILPGGANIVTAAGDVAILVSEGSGNWRCLNYQRASGWFANQATAAASGVGVDFTSIPAGVVEITVAFEALSLNGSADVLIQIGDAGGLETTGYNSHSYAMSQGLPIIGTGSTSGIVLYLTGASNTITGIVQLSLLDPSTNTWVASGNINYINADYVGATAGGKSLSAPLDRVRVTSSNGADVFDGSGKIKVSYLVA